MWQIVDLHYYNSTMYDVLLTIAIVLGVSVTTVVYYAIRSSKFKVHSVTPYISWLPGIGVIQRRSSDLSKEEGVAVASDENRNTDTKEKVSEPKVILHPLPSKGCEGTLTEEKLGSSEEASSDDKLERPEDETAMTSEGADYGAGGQSDSPKDTDFDPGKIDELLNFVKDCEESGEYENGISVQDDEDEEETHSDVSSSSPVEYTVTYSDSDSEQRRIVGSSEVAGFQYGSDEENETTGEIVIVSQAMIADDSEKPLSTSTSKDDESEKVDAELYDPETKALTNNDKMDDGEESVSVETAQMFEYHVDEQEFPENENRETKNANDSTSEAIDEIAEGYLEQDQANGNYDEQRAGKDSTIDDPNKASETEQEKHQIAEYLEPYDVTEKVDSLQAPSQTENDDDTTEISTDRENEIENGNLVFFSHEEKHTEDTTAEVAMPLAEDQIEHCDTSLAQENIELYPEVVTTRYYEELEPDITVQSVTRMNESLASFVSMDSDELDVGNSTSSHPDAHRLLQNSSRTDSVGEGEDDVFHCRQDEQEEDALQHETRDETGGAMAPSTSTEEKEGSDGGYTIEQATLVTIPEELIEYHTVLTFCTGYYVIDDKEKEKERKARRAKRSRDRAACEMIATGVYKPYDLFRIINHYMEKWFDTEETKVYIVTPTIDSVMLTQLLDCMQKTPANDEDGTPTTGGALEQLCTRDIGPATVKLSPSMKNLYHQKVKSCVWTSKVGMSAFNCKFLAGEYQEGKVELLITSANFTKAHLNSEKRNVHNDRQRDTLVILKTTPQYFHEKYMKPLEPVLRKLL
ncbi:otolith matrix protein OMM-64-like isoform X2 [Ptychodera flava]|uniref:otolith matrix protein OMM-64-like isoform X2 n=1 Tax=Ptychodera flava TaxID=63121 RepID=UPI00396A7AEE